MWTFYFIIAWFSYKAANTMSENEINFVKFTFFVAIDCSSVYISAVESKIVMMSSFWL